METLRLIGFIVYCLAGYWAVNRTIYANYVMYGDLAHHLHAQGDRGYVGRAGVYSACHYQDGGREKGRRIMADMRFYAVYYIYRI